VTEKIDSSGKVEASFGGKLLPVLLVACVSAIAGVTTAVVGDFASKRAADVEAAKLALNMLSNPEEGPGAQVARRFAIDLLQQSTGVDVNETDYVLWVEGKVPLARFSMELEPLSPQVETPCPHPSALLSRRDTVADDEVSLGRIGDALIRCGQEKSVAVEAYNGVRAALEQ